MSKASMRSRNTLRVTAVNAPPEPPGASGEEASSARACIPGVIPTGLLDRLLVAIVEFPVLEGERAVIEAAVEAVASIVPSCAVGVCFVPQSGSSDSRAGEQVVIKRLPEGAPEMPAGVDPTRI